MSSFTSTSQSKGAGSSAWLASAPQWPQKATSMGTAPPQVLQVRSARVIALAPPDELPRPRNRSRPLPAGAGIGQLAGGDTEATLIGAAVGGATGYMLGNEGDKKKAQAERDGLHQEMNTVMVKVTNSNGSIIQVPLRKQGIGYIGTRGEYYATLPTEDQLRPVYGF